ncbi:hypothetical protein [Endozoicomonas acroporae]|uniref:hypothetical protein n=1 Tax=Endozoicomonas acroporae TaxID=1701104 RepID=UPI0013D3EAFC|nr:hypothetical protein [Endozoicomonas acroporae]
MNNFDQKTRDQVALISALVLHINSLTDELYLNLQFSGHVNELSVGFIPLPYQSGPFTVGDQKFWHAFYMSTYLDASWQEEPAKRQCTLDQMLYVLHQIKQALTEDHSKEKAA